MRNALALAGTFVVVLGLVVGVAALAPTVTGDTPEQSMPAIENPQYSDEDLIADGSPGEADVTMDAEAENQTIVIDPGIEPGPDRPRVPFFFGSLGPETTERDVMPLVNALVENGHNVRIYTPEENRERSGPPRPGSEDEQLSPVGEELADADAFVTFRTDYSDEALDDIETFASEDGRVLVATEPDESFEEPGGAGLDSALGVTEQPGYVYNLEENDLNYQRIYAEPTGDAAVTEGVDRVVFPTAAPVAAAGSANGTLTPTEGAELSTTRAATDAPVLVQRGNVVMVGDTDFLVPENTQRADTDVLVGNLADFLVTNDRNPGEQAPNPPEPEKEGPPGPRRPGGPEGGDRPPEPDSEPTPTPTPVE
ncbi:hypothetical protein BRD09_07155 [Halobacteriales archaeon SW_10_68_16]|jgi:hypothetical protein|nr:MAG: hypothetical protein BRD09_07155 [Halobacteriales archaeon SW_10_68_16]